MEGGRLKAKQHDGRCLPCFALEGEPTRVQPHERLRMMGSQTLPTGTREAFLCDACGQRLVRFLATQTRPLPSDRWRFESAATQSFSGSAAPLIDRADPNVDAASELADDCLSSAEHPQRAEREY